MDENITPPRPRPRRRKTRMELFKEQYLPYLILLLAAAVIVTFIIGAVKRDRAETAGNAQTAHSFAAWQEV